MPRARRRRVNAKLPEHVDPLGPPSGFKLTPLHTEHNRKTLTTRFWASDGLLLAPTGPLSDVDLGLIL